MAISGSIWNCCAATPIGFARCVCVGQAPRAIRAQRGLQSSCRRSLYRVARSLGTGSYLLVFGAFCQSQSRRPVPGRLSRSHSLRPLLNGTRIAIVNDVYRRPARLCVARSKISKPAARRSSLLRAYLLTLWHSAPGACPLCAAGIPLEDAGGFRNAFTTHFFAAVITTVAAIACSSGMSLFENQNETVAGRGRSAALPALQPAYTPPSSAPIPSGDVPSPQRLSPEAAVALRRRSELRAISLRQRGRRTLI
jgi:hypothetical protein